jgi:hypothetical protein
LRTSGIDVDRNVTTCGDKRCAAIVQAVFAMLIAKYPAQAEGGHGAQLGRHSFPVCHARHAAMRQAVAAQVLQNVAQPLNGRHIAGR